jgi:enoyl-[acyl-carrier protein] reductase I
VSPGRFGPSSDHASNDGTHRPRPRLYRGRFAVPNGDMMGFLTDKKILITGLLSNRSIAYGVARACRREGATLAFTYVNDELKDRVVKIAAEFDDVPVLRCDVTRDEDIDALFATLGSEWGGLDGVLHSIAFAPREALSGDFLNALTRDAFATAHDVSSYSLAALAKGARPLMQGRNGALVTLTYLGAVRALPSYNVMGLAKASLEANVRYLSACLGPEQIRVNGISAGPIKTLAAAGIGGFSKIFNFVEKNAPLRRNVTIEEVGNVAAFLMSDLASAITGEITYVDCGFSTVAAGLAEE